MKKILGVLAVLATVAAFAAPVAAAGVVDPIAKLPDAIKRTRVLRVGSQQTYPPIEFRNVRSGEVVGLSADLLGEIARRLQLRLEWVQSDYGALITGAKAGRFDLVSGGISDQPEREKELDFVNYMMAGTGILCLIERAGDFRTIEDFSGRKVAFTFGAKKVEAAVKEASDALVAAGKEPIGIVMLPNTSDAKMQLDLKRVDGYLNETFTLAYLSKQTPATYAMVQDGRYVLTHLVTSWGFTKQNEDLRDAVRIVAQEMLEDGFFEHVAEKWGLTGGLLPEITVNTPWEMRQPR